MTAVRVYVVEDEAVTSMALCDRLQCLGYDLVGSAASGEQALREITELVPDLVLMDIHLTGPMSGLAVAAELRERQLDPAVVFLTAFSDPDVIQRAGETEAAGFLVKPFDERELHATLQMAHGQRTVERERRERLEERNALESRRLRTQKDEGLGRMAAALAHSFNNAFAGVLGLIDLARATPGLPGSAAEYLDDAVAAVDRAAELSRALRQYAGGATPKVTEFELGRLCCSTTMLLEELLPRNVRLVIRRAPEDLFVRADASLVRDMLAQLAHNAGEAVAERGGTIVITVGPLEGEADGAARTGRTWPTDWAPAGPAWACIAVKDEGGGISPDDLDKIFDPFYSTKLLGRGLGLALVLSCVRSLGGAVGVETGSGGSVFRVFLPMRQAPEGRGEAA